MRQQHVERLETGAERFEESFLLGPQHPLDVGAQRLPLEQRLLADPVDQHGAAVDADDVLLPQREGERDQDAERRARLDVQQGKVVSVQYNTNFGANSHE